MKYTQEELEKQDDETLNVRAGMLIGLEFMKYFKPCERWSDCGVLIDEVDIISIEKNPLYAGYLYAESEVACISSKNLKRAVTIVYILTKQGEL